MASMRKTKKAAKKQYRAALSRAGISFIKAKKKRRPIKRKASNPTVYDSAGRIYGKFRRAAAKIVARAIGGTVGKPKARKNPRSGALLFKTKAAATAYAKANRRRGVRISIKKVSKAK